MLYIASIFHSFDDCVLNIPDDSSDINDSAVNYNKLFLNLLRTIFFKQNTSFWYPCHGLYIGFPIEIRGFDPATIDSELHKNSFLKRVFRSVKRNRLISNYTVITTPKTQDLVWWRNSSTTDPGCYEYWIQLVTRWHYFINLFCSI